MCDVVISRCIADVSATEREHSRAIEQMKIEHEQQVFKLKQDNFVLSAKVGLQQTAPGKGVLLQQTGWSCMEFIPFFQNASHQITTKGLTKEM